VTSLFKTSKHAHQHKEEKEVDVAKAGVGAFKINLEGWSFVDL
jgi:hypothetical protein